VWSLRRTLAVVLAALCCTVAALSLAAERAAAVELIDESGQLMEPYQAWAEKARVPTVEMPIPLHVGGDYCADASWIGCTTWDPLGIGVEPSGRRPQLLLHELGHVFDFVVMGRGVVAQGSISTESTTAITPARLAFARILHRRPNWNASTHRSLIETFAQAYSYCALRGNRAHWRGRAWFGDGYNPTAAEHRKVCRLIRRQG
jgi:hypothetical protein